MSPWGVHSLICNHCRKKYGTRVALPCASRYTASLVVRGAMTTPLPHGLIQVVSATTTELPSDPADVVFERKKALHSFWKGVQLTTVLVLSHADSL